MLNRKRIFPILLLALALGIIGCSSQEYTTAKLAIQQSDWVKAAEWLPKAMAVEPDNPEIPIILGIEIYAQNKEWDKMNEMFDKAMSINPDKTIEVRNAFLPVKEVVRNYKEHFWAESFNAGVEQYRKIQDDPDNRDTYLERAIDDFKNAVLINPQDVQTHVTLAKSYFESGDNEMAIRSIEGAVKMNPESYEANIAAGQIIARTGGSKFEVLPFIEKAVEVNPSSSDALRELAGLYYDLDRKDESVSVFENAIANEEDDNVKADLFFNLGVIHNQMANYEGAEKAFDEAFYLNDQDHEAALGMASSYEGLGDKYLNGSDGFEKDPTKASRWYRKAESKLKDVIEIDYDNKNQYERQLELIRYKRDVAEGDN
ncbi:MAG: tetratricopeptide repeat protein [Candidatus Marinimicrobia bacterium]|nr:tetratricopeptide repeat protein [Candidatus Neomarinimicrobiota bacterium]